MLTSRTQSAKEHQKKCRHIQGIGAHIADSMQVHGRGSRHSGKERQKSDWASMDELQFVPRVLYEHMALSDWWLAKWQECFSIWDDYRDSLCWYGTSTCADFSWPLLECVAYSSFAEPSLLESQLIQVDIEVLAQQLDLCSEGGIASVAMTGANLTEK